jgi:hypothetical protein
VEHGVRQFVWVVAACAVVVAHVTPKSLCHACDKPCCAVGTARPATPSTEADTEHAGRCRLCAPADLRQAETNERPCHCQLTARHEQPLSLSRGFLTTFADGGPTVGPAFAQPNVPQALGLSREYVAASFAMPIRPPRILFGVWRN